MQTSPRQLADAFAPLAVAGAALVLSTWFIAPGVDLEALSRGPFGPVTWPKTMLFCLTACSLALFALRLRQLFMRVPATEEIADDYSDAKGAIGIAVIVAYAWLLTDAGFAISTFSLIAVWLLIGGLRRPLVVLATASMGTVALLYLFVKLSLMPLDRGKGAFETATVALYRLLGIY